MKCLFCDSETSVIETRLIDAGRRIVRRRKCEQGHRFRTIELVGGVLLEKEGNYLEPFDRSKAAEGIEKALYKRVLPEKRAARAAWDAAKKVEDHLLERIADDDRESLQVKPWEVGQLVLDQLEDIDWLGKLRYQSVLLDERKDVPLERRKKIQARIDSLLDEILEIRK